MPTPALRFKCGSPGCDRKFEKPEYLRQHTKASHSPSKPLPNQQTFKCGVAGCKAKPFSQLSSLHQHTKTSHSPPKPPPRDTFTCGVKGCNASFSQLPLLHQHTAVAHPKPKSHKNTPSGPSISASSTQGHSIPPTNTRSTRAPALMTRHVPSRGGYLPSPFRNASQAYYVPPYVYSPQCKLSCVTGTIIINPHTRL
ncbi:hypothetical protein C8J57DRAFT_376641 [Mycena rebaudengoi]|nr:hypothetical protein C8J57DRAFT_376641 [Mycena rebaudengoi]